MAWDEGYDFRATSGFVTDPANCTYVIFDPYPTTRDGSTFGWTSANDTRDRNSGIDARLAGVSFGPSGLTFRVDLPNTGNFAISLAIGDASFGRSNMGVEIRDTSTAKITLSSLATNAAEWYDATGVKRTSAADWVANQASSTQTFSTTILNLVMTGSSDTYVSHLFISEQGGGGNPWYAYAQMREKTRWQHNGLIWTPAAA